MMSDTKRNLAHAVHATGPHTTPLAGGRSRLTANGVPVLELRDELADAVSESARKFLDPNEETEWLIGEWVRLDNPTPQNGTLAPGEAPEITFRIGAETLDEAAKTVIGQFESVFGSKPPEWVESSHPVLGAVLADHYHCEDRSESND